MNACQRVQLFTCGRHLRAIKVRNNMMWMVLVLIYGLLKGVREVVKKKALSKNTVIEVLFFYTLFSMVLCLPHLPQAGGLHLGQYGAIALKSLFIFIAWILSFKAIEKLPISVYGILDLSRVLFATFLGVIVLGETLSLTQWIGLVLVLSGLLLLKLKKHNRQCNDTEKIPFQYLLFALTSCMLNAASGLMDKLLMKDISSSQLQFWYMLFLLCYYIIYILVTRTRLSLSALKNYWIYILAILFVIADYSLFVANGYPESRVTVMTLIKQSCCLVTILAGKFIFHEKNIAFKLLCAGIIVTGIVIAVL